MSFEAGGGWCVGRRQELRECGAHRREGSWAVWKEEKGTEPRTRGYPPPPHSYLQIPPHTAPGSGPLLLLLSDNASLGHSPTANHRSQIQGHQHSP